MRLDRKNAFSTQPQREPSEKFMEVNQRSKSFQLSFYYPFPQPICRNLHRNSIFIKHILTPFTILKKHSVLYKNESNSRKRMPLSSIPTSNSPLHRRRYWLFAWISHRKIKEDVSTSRAVFSFFYLSLPTAQLSARPNQALGLLITCKTPKSLLQNKMWGNIPSQLFNNF